MQTQPILPTYIWDKKVALLMSKLSVQDLDPTAQAVLASAGTRSRNKALDRTKNKPRERNKTRDRNTGTRPVIEKKT